MASAASETTGRRGGGIDDAPLLAIVDDDPLLRETLAGNLGDCGYRVAGFADGPSFLDALEKGCQPVLVLLDWKMPGLSGIEVLRRLRDLRPALPVIFLTVLSDQFYEETALLGGAVDFIEKARSFTILHRRIQLILAARQAAAPLERRVSLGPLSLDPECRRVRWRGLAVDLTVSEFAIVAGLAERGGRDMSYRELYDAAHGRGFRAGAGDEGYRTALRAAVKRIREKFRAADPAFDAIGNYPGFGYRWVVEDDASG